VHLNCPPFVRRACWRYIVDMDALTPESAEAAAQVLTGHLSWLFLAGVVLLLSRTAIENIVAGVVFKQGTELDFDQPLLLNGRPSRLIRVGLLKTVYYMDDRKSKMIVPNTQLVQLIVEVVLAPHSVPLPSVHMEKEPSPAITVPGPYSPPPTGAQT